MTRKEFILKWRLLSGAVPELKGRCFYCGRHMVMKGGRGNQHNPFLCTEEHVVSQWKNPHAQYNRVYACLACNSGKCGANTDAYREWFGKPFFCEEILGCPVPNDSSTAGDGTPYFNFDDIINASVTRYLAKVSEIFYNNGRLERALKKIMYDAGCYKHSKGKP